MINQVTLIGNTGRDIEVRILENGNKVATVSIATTESYKDKSDQWQQVTEWHNIVIWRPSGTVEKIKKGDKVFIQGKITTRKYTGKDGADKQTTEIVAALVRSLEPVKVGSQHATDVLDNAFVEPTVSRQDKAPEIDFDNDLPF